MGFTKALSYFKNELFQIGGYKLLRGFDEESIYAKQVCGMALWSTGTLLGLNSIFFVFTDVGWSRDEQYKNSLFQILIWCRAWIVF